MFDKKRYAAKYYIKNKKQMLISQEQWRENNPKYMKNWREKNKERRLEYQRGWEKDNKKLRSKYLKEWQRNNKEEIRKKKKKYYKENKENYIKYSKKQREKNPEYQREWRKNNPKYVGEWLKTEKGKANNQRGAIKRRAREREIINTLTFEEWLDILKKYKYRCAYCGIEFDEKNLPEREHVIPISKGGDNVKENVVPACRNCNAKKYNKILIKGEKI